MRIEQNFIDLRLNRQADQGNESFWPSFTDIMTVIVMIFLIAMVVLLIRNMELVNEVRATMEAERTAMELARETGREKEDLATELHSTSEQLHSVEERAAQLQLQVMRLQEETTLRAKVISQRNEELAALNEERNDLAQQAAQLLLTRQELETSMVEARSELAAKNQETLDLQHRLDTMQSHFRETEQQLASAKIDLSKQTQLLSAAQMERQQFEEKYLVLADDFDNLKVRYDKLVRPARTSKGRHLVEVRYRKKGSAYNISWREGGSGEFVSVSSKKLDQNLSRIMQAHPEGLYVKVILPSDSGLSYDEAWNFTNSLHQKYDYYFQDSPPPAAEQKPEP